MQKLFAIKYVFNQLLVDASPTLFYNKNSMGDMLKNV